MNRTPDLPVRATLFIGLAMPSPSRIGVASELQVTKLTREGRHIRSLNLNLAKIELNAYHVVDRFRDAQRFFREN